MPKSSQRLVVLGASAALAVGLSSCGSSEKTVATIGKTKVTQATLSHWMGTVLGGDFQASLGAKVPEGLVSDPLNYPRCVSVAEGLVPKGASGKPALSAAQLRVRCRQLNTGVRQQALGYVLDVLWRAEEGAEMGIKVSEAEISRKLNEVIYREYKNPAGFRSMLTTEHRTVADERFLLKRNILEDKFLARLKAQSAKLGGGPEAEAKLIRAENVKLTAKTSCSPGYLAWECKQYKAADEASPSVAVVLERLRSGV